MANPLNNITSFAKGLFSKETPSVIGVDISSSAIKVVQLKRKRGKAVLETYGALALGPYGERAVGQSVKLTPDKIVEAIKDVLTESKVTTKSAAAAIPLASSLVTRIEVPTLNEDKLKTIIPLEARKYIPVSVSEVMLDWHVVPQGDLPESEKKGEEKKTEVLLVAIHKDTINNFQSILKKADINVSFYEIEVFSTIRSVLGPGVAPIMVADCGASTTKLYIVEAGVVKTSHIVNRGGQDITTNLATSLSIPFENAEALKRSYGRKAIQNQDAVARATQSGINFLLTEIERTTLSFERQYNKPIKKIILTGGSALLAGFQEAAKERLSAEVVLGHPFEKTDSPAFLERSLMEAGPEFAVAIGIALRKLEERE